MLPRLIRRGRHGVGEQPSTGLAQHNNLARPCLGVVSDDHHAVTRKRLSYRVRQHVFPCRHQVLVTRARAYSNLGVLRYLPHQRLPRQRPPAFILPSKSPPPTDYVTVLANTREQNRNQFALSTVSSTLAAAYCYRQLQTATLAVGMSAWLHGSRRNASSTSAFNTASQPHNPPVGAGNRRGCAQDATLPDGRKLASEYAEDAQVQYALKTIVRILQGTEADSVTHERFREAVETLIQSGDNAGRHQ